MEITTAVQAATLMEDFDETNRLLDGIKNQKKNISGELILNCTDFQDFHLESVKIDEDDAKRILQFAEDYLNNKIESILKKLKDLN